MNLLGFAAVLGLVVGTWAQVQVLRPMCDSPDVEEAAIVAQDYLNAQHSHGYKYVLNRIEDVKIYPGANGDDTYLLEIDLLETTCHVLDPTPLVNCTVRLKLYTSVEGDCDVVLKKVAGVLTVTAFKCKTDESREDLCVDCYTLLPLNDTAALDFVQASLATFNNNTVNVTYAIMEVGRMSSKFVIGRPHYSVEYIVAEANCTDAVCTALTDPMAERGICFAIGFRAAYSVQCRMFPAPMVPVLDANITAPPAVAAHSPPHRHGLKHHKLTSLHDPHMTGLLSAESVESAEIVPVAPAVVAAVAPAAAAPAAAAPAPDPAPASDPTPAADPAPAADSVSDADSSSREVPVIVKRDVADAAAAAAAVDSPAPPLLLVPACPGRVRYFS